MKTKYSIWCLGSALVIGAVSCKEKPKTTGAEPEETSVVGEVVEAVKEAVAPKPAATLSDEERAAKLGFAKYLPADTEVVMSVYNSEKAKDQLKALKLYGVMEKSMAMSGGGIIEDEFMLEEDLLLEDEDAVAPDAEQADGQLPDEDVPEDGMAEAPSPWLLLGREVTIAMGKTTGEQTGRLLTVSRRMGYFQARALGKATQSFAKTGDMADFAEAMAAETEGGAFIKTLLEDSESGIALFEKTEMPPLYIAFRAKEGELDQAAQLVNESMGIFGMAGEMAAPVEFETGGAKFAGYKLLGEEIAKTMEEERESMEEDLDPAMIDALLSAIRKKNLIAVTGTVGEYVVMMIGGSEESLKLVAETKDSLVATDGLNFSDPFADKQLVSVIYGEEKVWDEIVEAAGGLSAYALGLRDGIAGGGGLGETRDLETMLQMIADREKALMALGGASDLGMVAYVDEGLKIESFGGYDKGAVDWSAKTKLSHLGDSGDNMLFLNIPSSAAYDEKMGDYLESIVETMYAAAIKMSALEIEAPELDEMKEFTQLFDAQFREDLVGLYGALSESLSGGLGHEVALVIDLKGSMPAIPGIPQELVDEAKAPRMTLLAPVTDRDKIKDSWAKVNNHMTSILGKVSEMTEEKIPMQKPISSEKDGMTTWFFSFPFFQDDFLPSVTVSDNWFAASTSKTQAVDLMGKAAAGGKTGEGVQFYVNFNAMTDYAEEMLKVVEKNSAVVFTDEFALENFNENKVSMKEMIDACREFESMSWTARRENGTMHNVVHFRMK